MREKLEDFINYLTENKQLLFWLDDGKKDVFNNSLSLLIEKPAIKKLEKFGEECYKFDIPFGEISIIFELFLEKLNTQEKEYLIINRDIFARAYMIARFKNEIGILQEQIISKSYLVSEEKKDIINHHVNWLKDFISYVLGEKAEFSNVSENECEVSKWIKSHKWVYFLTKRNKLDFEKTHIDIHHLLENALIMFKNKKYFYFMLFYVDIRSYSLRLRDILNSIFLSEKVISLYIDHITDLFNRFKFLEDKESFKDKTLLLINIKNFSKINLIYGLEFGDYTLKKVANYLTSLDVIRVYRIYADEFAIIVKDSDNAKDIFSQIDEKITLEDISFTISFYGAFRNIDTSSLELCEYELIYDKSNNLVDANHKTIKDVSKYKKHLSMSQKLKFAIASDSVYPYFQPIYDIKENKITKYECLMRVKDEHSNILRPIDFMEILEHMYIYREYTKSMILKSFKHFSDKDYEFSINLAISDIENSETIVFLRNVIKEYPDTAKKLTIELLENEAVLNVSLVNSFFKEMKSYGVKTALDDFGSGFSNFAQIFTLSLDYIKIDGSIIKQLYSSNKMYVLLQTLVKMAHSLDMKVIAEFVSEEKLFNSIKENGVDYAQGYFIGEPKNSTE
jgi:EAL domain-containing protein (putative c-di-GMP-specific phosphodiesterase class I)/GGDEF domain-containing protein